MIQPLLHEQPDDPIGVKQKVTAAGRSVSDDGIERFELRGLW